MNLNVCTKKELYQIAMNEQMDLQKRYEAARLLQELNIGRVDTEEVRKHYESGLTSWEIAYVMNIPAQVTNGIISKYKRWGMV